MARIPDADIERMKAEVSLVRLVEASGVTLEKRGADHVGRCPFHDDKTPSLVVTPAKNLWRCFGACDAGGDVIAWVMKREGVSFRHAVELLKSDYAPDPQKRSGAAPVTSKSTVAKLPTLATPSAAIPRACSSAATARPWRPSACRRRCAAMSSGRACPRPAPAT